MEQRPKRRKMKDNPYVLNFKEELNEYEVIFKDSRGILQKIKVSSTIYHLLDQFELDDLSELNEFDNHIEHLDITEEQLHNRVKEQPLGLEDLVIQKATFEELHNAIKQLPEIQQRRVKKYYFLDKTVYQIAQEESSSHQAISKSLNMAIDKLKEILKK